MSDDVATRFGAFLRKRREGLHESTGDPAFGMRRFATAAGVSATYQSHIERGMVATPSMRVLERYAELLQVDLEELVEVAGKNRQVLIGRVKALPESQLPHLATALDGIEAGRAGRRIIRI